MEEEEELEEEKERHEQHEAKEEEHKGWEMENVEEGKKKKKINSVFRDACWGHLFLRPDVFGLKH